MLYGQAPPNYAPLSYITLSNSTTISNPGSYSTVYCDISICRIVCDVYQGCYRLTVNIDASVQEVNVKCSAPQSCYSMLLNMDLDTLSNVSISCTDQDACQYAWIHADKADYIDISCNYTSTSSKSYAACGLLRLYAKNSGHSRIYCNVCNY